MKTMLYFILYFISLYNVLSAKTWPFGIQFFDDSEQFNPFLDQFLSGKEQSKNKDNCQHCFNVFTVARGNHMIVERCGDENCIPIINNTDLDEYHQPTVHYNFDECGLSDNVQSLKSGKIQTKISAGVKDTLRPAEYPWLVRIESRSTMTARTVTLCSGTLIHPQWIITAAHCMFDTKTNRLYPAYGVNLYMGHYDRVKSSNKEYIKQPALYLIHPEFSISRKSPAPIHDLALIKLARPVPISSSIDIACLPDKSDKLHDGKLAFTAGWGHTSLSATVANIPRKAKIRISPHACRGLKIDQRFHICGRNNRGKNICSGDSGTGLMVRAGVQLNDNEPMWKWHLFGVASYGLEECSRRVNHDNAFASVPADIDWIREVMETY